VWCAYTAVDEAVREEIRAVTAKGFAQALFLSADDCQKSYDDGSVSPA
jgi:hypothetical protein